MNSLATTDSKPLRRQPMCDPRKPLAILFAAYPEPFAKGDTEQLRRAQVEAYMLGLDGVPEWAIRESVTAFIQGAIERSNRSKLPTAEQIAALAREKVSAEATKQSILRQREKDAQERREEEARNKLTPDEMEVRRKRAAEIMSRAGFHSMPTEDGSA